MALKISNLKIRNENQRSEISEFIQSLKPKSMQCLVSIGNGPLVQANGVNLSSITTW